ncbi:MAG TPA: pyrrolo-quinoline quinone [Candidatus Paceibacterota bacterium]|nr:pyrrolo-quinoline quinone [Candidatus Paceibacterota bacterium]
MKRSFKVASLAALFVVLLGVGWWQYGRLEAARSLEDVPLGVSVNTQNGKIDVLTYHYDDARDGVDPDETTLTPVNVNVNTFGKIMTLPVDGQVYAQPLYVSGVKLADGSTHDVLYVATANDSLYAFDANTGAQLWKDSFIDPYQWVVPVPVQDVKTLDITPTIGIIGTPVIDPTSNTLYVVSKVEDVQGINTQPPTFAQYLHAIDLATGKEKFNGPSLIVATDTLPNGTSIDFDPLLGNQRGALTLLDGTVYIPWASHGDVGDFHGWVMGYAADDVQKQTAVFMDTPYGDRGGIWMSGDGLATDGTYLYSSDGDGDFSAAPGAQNFGESTVKLDPSTLKVVDYFATFDAEKDGQDDLDAGTGGVHLITDKTTSSTLLVTGDKQGDIYVLDASDLGGYSSSTNNDIQEIKLGKPLLNNMAYFDQTLYAGGNNLPLQAFTLNDRQFSTAATSKTGNTFGTGGFNGQGTNPVVSANGTSSAIVWALDNSAYGSNGPAVLYAYNARNLGQELYSSNQDASRDAAGPAVKFTAALVANGKVFVPGASQVTVYGLLN